jgi:hypothetical protein
LKEQGICCYGAALQRQRAAHAAQPPVNYDIYTMP